MDFFQAVSIGLVQGVTEWFPVSSKTHLVIAERLLGIDASGVALEVVLHLGTLASAVVFFRARWARILLRPGDGAARRALGMLLLATLPVAVAGLAAHHALEARLHDRRWAAAGFLACGAFLVAAGRKAPGGRDVGWGRAFLIGAAQALALLPGVSRSGMSIGTGLLAGVRRERAVEFSFMCVVPAVLGATILKMGEIGGAARDYGAGALCLAAGAAFVSGLAAIGVLRWAVVAGRFSWFGWYCVAIGTAWAIWG